MVVTPAHECDDREKGVVSITWGCSSKQWKVGTQHAAALSTASSALGLFGRRMLTIGGGVPCRHADRTSIEGKDTYGGERSRQATYTAAPSRLGLPVPFSQTDAGSTELSPQAPWPFPAPPDHSYRHVPTGRPASPSPPSPWHADHAGRSGPVAAQGCGSCGQDQASDLSMPSMLD